MFGPTSGMKDRLRGIASMASIFIAILVLNSAVFPTLKGGLHLQRLSQTRRYGGLGHDVQQMPPALAGEDELAALAQAIDEMQDAEVADVRARRDGHRAPLLAPGLIQADDELTAVVAPPGQAEGARRAVDLQVR